MLQGRQRGEDRIWLLRGQYYLVLSYRFLFLQYFHNIIDLFSALSLTGSLRSPTVLSPGYQKPRAYLGWLWPPKKSRRLARSNPGLPVAQTFPFTTSSQLLSACVPVSFLWSCLIIPWSQPLTFLFFFPDHSYLNCNYFSLFSSMLPQAHQEHAWIFASILFWYFLKLITQFSVSLLLWFIPPSYFIFCTTFPPRHSSSLSFALSHFILSSSFHSCPYPFIHFFIYHIY